jgi:flavin-dependent dehydrogenase
VDKWNTDILIIGGGPAGAWTALLLAERGYSVAIWDRAAFPRDKACGEYLNPGAVRILDARQALDGLSATPIVGARIFDPRGRYFDGSYQPEDGHGLSVRRTSLDAQIVNLARAAGVTVWEGATYTKHRWEDGCMNVSGRGPDANLEARCRVLVGADGVHSAVARAMGVVRPLRRHQRVAFVSHVSGISGLSPRIEMHAGLRGCIGIGPGPDGVANVTVVVRPSDAKSLGTDLPKVVEGYTGLRGRFDSAMWEPSVLRTGTFGHTVTSAVADGVLLVGDSAEFVDPFTGEGVFFALRGAELAVASVSAALAAGPASRDSLLPYDRTRHKALGASYTLCDLIQRFVGTPILLSYVTSRMRKHPDLADVLIRTTGDILKPRTVFSPLYVARLLT